MMIFCHLHSIICTDKPRFLYNNLWIIQEKVNQIKKIIYDILNQKNINKLFIYFSQDITWLKVTNYNSFFFLNLIFSLRTIPSTQVLILHSKKLGKNNACYQTWHIGKQFFFFFLKWSHRLQTHNCSKFATLCNCLIWWYESMTHI